MKQFKSLLGVLLVAILSLGALSCAKVQKSDSTVDTVQTDSGATASIDAPQAIPTPQHATISATPEPSFLELLLQNASMFIPVLVVLLETVLRLLPTDKNYSLIRLLIFILEKIPNKGIDPQSGKSLVYKHSFTRQLVAE
jgi:hypothetical protein